MKKENEFRLVDKGTSVHLMKGEKFVLSILKTYNEVMVSKYVSVIFDERKVHHMKIAHFDAERLDKFDKLKSALEEVL